jgi:asparagine synthase (glutamine-hydrolysing)
MCGFIGLLSNAGDKRTAFQHGLAAIQSRGTSIDVYEQDNEQYGYVRLPTDDVSNSKLDRISHEKQKLLFNGLVTNVAYLVDAFGLPDETKRSDTCCLLAGLSMHGTAFLRRARGMFAIAFITETSITLVRDTIGIKPLYFALEDGSFAFASELKALRPLARSLHEVLPGHIVTYDRAAQTITKQPYSYQSYQHYTVQELQSCLHEAVVDPTRRYLQNSAKRVALLLSGGIDSSINAALLAQSLPPAHKRRVLAFCIGEDEAPDVQAATRLARTLKLPLVHVRPYPPEVSLQLLPKIVYKAESPYARVIKVALLYDALASSIKAHDIDIVVGGEGADELFFGYHRFIDGLTHQQSAELFDIFFRKIFHYTLLQRYDRMMAQRQIEGRVPYLDQELVELTRHIPPEAKIQHGEDGHTSKLPLRVLARQLGLPGYISARAKEKMTAGATGKDNSTSRAGYLEREALVATGLSFQQLVHTLYCLYFGSALDRGDMYTEEQAMQLASQYRAANKVEQLRGQSQDAPGTRRMQ